MSTQPSSTAASSGGFSYALEFEKPIARMEQEIQRLDASQAESGRDSSDIVRAIRGQLDKALRQTYAKLTPWETVLVARHPRRPLLRDYIRLICDDFCELRGDRLYGDDNAIVCGFARIDGIKVMLVGHHKGRDTREKIASNFGCAHPEGYRKALHKMKLAAKFGLPIVCLIDTPGAYPGIAAEERGIASAIAVNLMEISRLPTPVVAAVIGEGGSGGALGIGVADQVAVMQYAYYSVISPEGCAAILWKSGEHAARAAESLRLRAHDLKQLELIDAIIEEPLGAAHRNPEQAARNLESWLGRTLRDLRRLKTETLLRRRYERLRNLGAYYVVKGEMTTSKVSKARPKRAARKTRETAKAGTNG